MMKPFPDIPESTGGGKLIVTNTSGISVPVETEWMYKLIGLIETGENVHFQQIEVVYVDEDQITELNREYLEKDYITDIITFRYDENSGAEAIEGTLYCCAQRITEQSQEFGSGISNEFYRVFIHGLLHLTGYNDSDHSEKEAMTTREDFYLKQMNSAE